MLGHALARAGKRVLFCEKGRSLLSDGPDGAASFTPAVAVNDAGQVAVSYYSLRNSPRRRPPKRR